MTIIQDNVSLTSVYVSADDGTKLALDVWLPKDRPAATKLPCIFTLTRYWRSFGFKEDCLAWQRYFKEAQAYIDQGFTFAVADSRGSGASFGTRECEFYKAELSDIKPIMAWIADQPWSNGKVASTGTSYTADTAIYCASDSPPALKAIVPFAMDFDGYDQLLRPGGLENCFTNDWGAFARALDQNDAKTVSNAMKAWFPDPMAQKNITGVRPVDEDIEGSLLASAVDEHAGNFSLDSLAGQMEYRDQDEDVKRQLSQGSVYNHKDKIEASKVPIIYRTGWLDAGTPQGALSLFNTFSNPLHVIIGPWNHGNYYFCDPYKTDEPVALPIKEKAELTMNSLRPYVSDDFEGEMPETGILEYFTFGENSWKITREWPLPMTQIEGLYLHESHLLKTDIPEQDTGEDIYQVDPDATTGTTNRWHTNLNSGPVLYPDRKKADKKLLVYETPPLTEDTEITGHPEVTLFIASNKEDSDLIVYLEDVAPDGTVYYITEGCLRARHRKVSTPPYEFTGPWHSCRRDDAEKFVPGEIVELRIALIPTSVLFRKGHRIRLAIAGADKDTFLPIKGIEGTIWQIQRNRIYPSCLSLPVIPKNKR